MSQIELKVVEGQEKWFSGGEEFTVYQYDHGGSVPVCYINNNGNIVVVKSHVSFDPEDAGYKADVLANTGVDLDAGE